MADRIEKEIEEILRKIDNFVPERTRRPARKAGQPLSSAQSWLAHRLARISLNQVMMWSLVGVLIAFVAHVGWLILASLFVFLAAFALSLLSGGRKARTEKRWRGEPLDLSGPSWPNRIKAWIKGRRRA
jgi:hypothetical protein